MSRIIRFLSSSRNLAGQKGLLKSFDEKKFEGVISPITKSFVSKEVFIRPESFKGGLPNKNLVEDQKVEYEWCTVPSQNGPIRMAINITGPNGAELQTTEEV